MFYENFIEQNKEWIDGVFAKLDKKLSRTAVKSRDKIPYTVDKNGEHDNRNHDPHCWTNGFWGGLMWLMYEHTKNEDYKLTALRSEEMQDRAFARVEGLHHDVGFMWHLLSGVNYRLTGDMAARNRNIFCAMSLASRFKLNGNYIRAWNDENSDGIHSNNGWTIIDCMMNLPILYWASEELGDDRFKQIAIAHADTAMTHHVRPDGSINHIVTHNLETGEMKDVIGGQGFSKDSCWTRGEAWALYGYVLSYIHTGEVRYLDTAKKVAHYSIAALAANDFVMPVDFRAPEHPYYDSTAAGIMACGLIEIAKAVPEHEKKTYLTAALKLLKVLDEQFCDWSEEKDCITFNGTEAYYGGQNKPIIYGDYFFAEAILKLRGSEFLPW